jgi:hypothetical protein
VTNASIGEVIHAAEWQLCGAFAPLTCVADTRVAKDGRESVRCIHPSTRIAELVIGRAFARPGGDAPQDEISIPNRSFVSVFVLSPELTIAQELAVNLAPE